MAMMVSKMPGDAPAHNGAWLYLDEVMHRILNDYTVMLSTVRYAALTVSDAKTGAALDEITHRLNASATAFRALSPPLDHAPRDLDEELETLCANLTASILAKEGIQLSFGADPVQLDAQRCWKICLVVSELLTNAARHAFLGRERGSIAVELAAFAGMIRCVVIDDGIAPEKVVPGRGSAILDAIAAELGGTLSRQYTGLGSTMVLEVPLTEHLDRRSAPMIAGALHDQH